MFRECAALSWIRPKMDSTSHSVRAMYRTRTPTTWSTRAQDRCITAERTMGFRLADTTSGSRARRVLHTAIDILQQTRNWVRRAWPWPAMADAIRLSLSHSDGTSTSSESGGLLPSSQLRSSLRIIVPTGNFSSIHSENIWLMRPHWKASLIQNICQFPTA